MTETMPGPSTTEVSDGMIIDQVGEALLAYRGAAAALRGVPAKLREQVSDPNRRRFFADMLYWGVPEIPASAIAEDLLGVRPNELCRLI